MATLVYDGDCGFCTRCVGLIPRRVARSTLVVPYQRADLAALDLSAAECASAVQWIGNGQRAAGAAAVARLLLSGGGLWRVLGVVLLTPPVSWLAEVAYRVVAANRMRLPGGTPACAVPPTDV